MRRSLLKPLGSAILQEALMYSISMKIVITLPVLLTGGTEFQTMTLVKVLAGDGYNVVVCCFYDAEQSMVESMEHSGAQVELLKLNREDGLWVLLKSLISYFRKEGPSICHVQYMAPGFIPVVAARLARVPILFATVHQPGHPYGKKAHFLLRLAAKLCSQFICISRSVEKSWFGSSTIFNVQGKHNSSNHCTIFNAVDLKSIVAASKVVDKYEMRNRYDIGTGFTIGCVARMRVEKGQRTLIEAFAEVVKMNPAAQLLMIGDGPDKLVLLQLAEDLCVNQNVIWLGRLAQDEVYKLYGLMDVVVVPSLFEGFGLTAAEAMAAGLPVIASNIDGLAEVVKHGETGFLFPAGDSEALSAALVQMLNNPDLAKQYGRNGQDRVQRNFMIEQFSVSILELYKSFQSRI
jgi:glycosyltransferase involved in cell wall biosynthesis